MSLILLIISSLKIGNRWWELNAKIQRIEKKRIFLIINRTKISPKYNGVFEWTFASSNCFLWGCTPLTDCCFGESPCKKLKIVFLGYVFRNSERL